MQRLQIRAQKRPRHHAFERVELSEGLAHGFSVPFGVAGAKAALAARARAIATVATANHRASAHLTAHGAFVT